MTQMFDTWRTEIAAELAEAVAERDAALLERDEARRAEAGRRAELAAASAAIDSLARRIEAEQTIEQQGAVVLHPMPQAISVALVRRIEGEREALRAAHTRAVTAHHVVDQANARIADLRAALDQLDLLAPAAADDASDAA